MKKNKTCKGCKWHDDYTWVCFNGDSDKRADITDNEFCCPCWEKNDGRYKTDADADTRRK